MIDQELRNLVYKIVVSNPVLGHIEDAAELMVAPGSAAPNSAMPKCADCGKLLGIYVNGKPYHYSCADKLGPLTSA
jgi:hypothetical protein